MGLFGAGQSSSPSIGHKVAFTTAKTDFIYHGPPMALHELHPFIRSEIGRLPEKPGVYVLFQVQIPLHAGGGANLRKSLRAARAKFPHATHFAVEVLLPTQDVTSRLRQVEQELKCVRTAGFIGVKS